MGGAVIGRAELIERIRAEAMVDVEGGFGRSGTRHLRGVARLRRISDRARQSRGRPSSLLPRGVPAPGTPPPVGRTGGPARSHHRSRPGPDSGGRAGLDDLSRSAPDALGMTAAGCGSALSGRDLKANGSACDGRRWSMTRSEARSRTFSTDATGRALNPTYVEALGQVSGSHLCPPTATDEPQLFPCPADIVPSRHKDLTMLGTGRPGSGPRTSPDRPGSTPESAPRAVPLRTWSVERLLSTDPAARGESVGSGPGPLPM